MTCSNSGIWFYGVKAEGLSGQLYGTISRIRTPGSLPPITCSIAYFVSCRTTTHDESGSFRFYQSTIAFTPSAGRWHFSWGYSTQHLAQPPYTGLYPQPNHDYELGIQLKNNNAQMYVTDLGTSTVYVMGTVPDAGTLWMGDKPGFLLEGFTTNINEMNVPAFKAYGFRVFDSPSSSSHPWPHASGVNQQNPGAPPSQIQTVDLGGYEYLIGNTSQIRQLPNDNRIW